jgi:antitoxin FitA
MAQLVVRDLAEDVKERLKRRATRHGRSLEAEVRDILSQVPEPPAAEVGNAEGLGTGLARILRETGITNEDVDELERIIEEGRKNWRTRDVEFGK